jgi:hypothetical protein
VCSSDLARFGSMPMGAARPASEGEMRRNR